MIKRLTSLLALSAFALNATAEPVAVSLPAFQCLGSKEGVRLPSKLSQLRKLGKLNEEQTINVEQWDGYKAIEKQLRFNGLTVLVITFTNEPERYMLSAVNIETPGWSVSPIRIGSPVQELLARVGVV